MPFTCVDICITSLLYSSHLVKAETSHARILQLINPLRSIDHISTASDARQKDDISKIRDDSHLAVGRLLERGENGMKGWENWILIGNFMSVIFDYDKNARR